MTDVDSRGTASATVGPDGELLALCAAHADAHARLAGLWREDDASPSPALQARLGAAERRCTALYDRLAGWQASSPAGLRALAEAHLRHILTDAAGEPESYRDRPLWALAHSILALSR